MTWFGTELLELPSTYERIIPPPGIPLVFRVKGWQLGYKIAHIKPEYTPKEKPAIGLQVERLDKPDQHHLWAIMGAEPVAQMEPELTASNGVGQVWTVERRGRKPRDHWTITVAPDRAQQGA